MSRFPVNGMSETAHQSFRTDEGTGAEQTNQALCPLKTFPIKHGDGSRSSKHSVRMFKCRITVLESVSLQSALGSISTSVLQGHEERL